MHNYIICFLDDEGKSLMSKTNKHKTNKHNEFEIFKRFMDWCVYKSGYLSWVYEQPSLKLNIEDYVNNTLMTEYIDEYRYNQTETKKSYNIHKIISNKY